MPITSAPLRAVIARLRQDVAALDQDRYLAPDLVQAARLVRDGDLGAAVPSDLLAEVRP